MHSNLCSAVRLSSLLAVALVALTLATGPKTAQASGFDSISSTASNIVVSHDGRYVYYVNTLANNQSGCLVCAYDSATGSTEALMRTSSTLLSAIDIRISPDGNYVVARLSNKTVSRGNIKQSVARLRLFEVASGRVNSLEWPGLSTYGFTPEGVFWRISDYAWSQPHKGLHAYRFDPTRSNPKLILNLYRRAESGLENIAAYPGENRFTVTNRRTGLVTLYGPDAEVIGSSSTEILNGFRSISGVLPNSSLVLVRDYTRTSIHDPYTIVSKLVDFAAGSELPLPANVQSLLSGENFGWNSTAFGDNAIYMSSCASIEHEGCGIYRYNVGPGSVDRLMFASTLPDDFTGINLNSQFGVSDANLSYAVYTDIAMNSDTGASLTGGQPTIIKFTSEQLVLTGPTTQFKPTRGSFNNVPLADFGIDANNAVVIAHGWNADATNPEGWVANITGKLCALSGSGPQFMSQVNPNSITWICQVNDTDIFVIDWSKDAFSTANLPLSAPWTAVRQGRENGVAAAVPFADKNYAHIHLIGHSAGTALLDSLSTTLKELNTATVQHFTLFDAYDPDAKSAYNIVDGTDMLFSQYAQDADYVDNYIDARPIFSAPLESDNNLFLDKTYNLLSNGYNVRVDNSDSDSDTLISFEHHSWPQTLYINSFAETNVGFFHYSRLASGQVSPLLKNTGGNGPLEMDCVTTSVNLPFDCLPGPNPQYRLFWDDVIDGVSRSGQYIEEKIRDLPDASAFVVNTVDGVSTLVEDAGNAFVEFIRDVEDQIIYKFGGVAANKLAAEPLALSARVADLDETLDPPESLLVQFELGIEEDASFVSIGVDFANAVDTVASIYFNEELMAQPSGRNYASGYNSENILIDVVAYRAQTIDIAIRVDSYSSTGQEFAVTGIRTILESSSPARQIMPDTWELLSIPEQHLRPGNVLDFLPPELTQENYGDLWATFAYDSNLGEYISVDPLARLSSLSGGFWFIQSTGAPIYLGLPGIGYNSASADTQECNNCNDQSITPGNNPGAPGWNLMGNAYSVDVNSESMVVFDADSCAGGCALGNVVASGQISSTAFRYDSTQQVYVTMELGQDIIPPWSGFWLSASHQALTGDIAVRTLQPY
jgi:hypothetical protein